MKHTHRQLGDLINVHSMLNTAAETLAYLRRHNTDSFILESLEFCSIGNKQSLEQIIGKKHIEYRQELERQELDYIDIVDSLKE